MATLGSLLADINLQEQQQKAELANQLLQEELKGRENFGYGFANALAGLPQQQGYGSWLSDAARAFGAAYTGRRDSAIDRARKNYENIAGQTATDINTALKFAEVAGKQQELAQKRMDKQIEQAAKEQEKIQMLSSAAGALKDLKTLADSGDITAMNKSTDNWMLSSKSSENIGKRQAALASLLPLTNQVARASGGSGINTLGEMMAYLGIPENATSSQIAGALPGISRKLGLDIPGMETEKEKKESVSNDYAKYGF